MRVPFLLLTPVCIVLGLVISETERSIFSTLDPLLVFVCALASHICVNTLNEYQDFKSGLDFKTRRTAFSGGSGALVDNPEAAKLILATSIASVITTLLIGTYFVLTTNLKALLIGIPGLAIIIFYTKWLNHHPILCLLAPGFCFGSLMVMGTQLALANTITVEAFIASLVPFFLVNNLLLLNQIPDRDADQTVGRNHFSIAYGQDKTYCVYACFAVAACFCILFGSTSGLLPFTSIIALVPASLSLLVFIKLNALGDDIGTGKLLPLLGLNTISVLLTPLTLAIGVWIA